MVTVTMEAEKETAVLKGKTALGLTIADGKGGLILNATWEGEHLEMDEAIAVLDCMIEKHVKDMFSESKDHHMCAYDWLFNRYPERRDIEALEGKTFR